MKNLDQNPLDQTILDLVTDACKHPPGHPVRQKNLTQVIRLVSKKLWKERTPYYEDALHKTWLYFCKYICPDIPKGGEKKLKGQPYDASQASVATWLNVYLKRRLQDYYIEAGERKRQEVSGWQDRDGEIIDLIDTLPAPPPAEPLWEKVRAWAEEDATGELAQKHIKGYPTVTCQVLILRRLLSESSWEELSQEFGLKIPTLASFYQRQCLPRLRDFGKSEGYIG